MAARGRGKTTSPLVLRAVGLLAGAAAAGVILLYGVARNRGTLPGWGREIMAIGWPTAILALAAVYVILGSRRAFGRSALTGFKLEPGEELLFDARLHGAEFYPDASRVPEGPTLREWLRQTRFSVRIPLRVWITDRRMLIGTIFGQAARAIPGTDVAGFGFVPGWRPFSRSLVVRFSSMGRVEALRLGGGARAEAVVDALEQMTGRVRGPDGK